MAYPSEQRSSGARVGPRCRDGTWLLAAAGVFLLPTRPAGAHTAVPGMGEFASGFLHPLLTPPHVLALLAYGLLLGQREPLRLQVPIVVFAGTAAAGLALTFSGGVAGVYPPVLIAVGLYAAGLVVLARSWPAWLLMATGAVVALTVGLDSGVDAGTPTAAAMKILFATWISLALFVVNAAFYVSLLPKVQWAQTGIRVAGSWIVAIALLMLAFALRR